jgi:hypothetical protein
MVEISLLNISHVCKKVVDELVTMTFHPSKYSVEAFYI